MCNLKEWRSATGAPARPSVGSEKSSAIEAHGILPKRIGVLVHDCWAQYWKLDESIHTLCNANILRELVYAKEITGQAWPDAMINLLLGANKLCEAALSSSFRSAGNPKGDLIQRPHREAPTDTSMVWY
jgi:hypothetical protein